MTSDSLDRRARQLRSRVLIRAHHFRQLEHADGAWYRLRRALADASEIWAVSPEDAEKVAAEGYPVEPVGNELAPGKQILRVPAGRVAQIPSARPLAPRLGAELLATDCLLLVPFGPADAGPSVSPEPDSTEKARP